jgi:hypothetical protein
MSNLIPKSTLKDWIVEDLTNLLPALNDNRYDIFNDLENLDHIADNIKSLMQHYGDKK